MNTWIRSSLLFVCLTGFITAPLTNAEAATFLKLKGQKQGEIKGSVTAKGKEGTILVESVSHEIVSPRDPASGQPTGKAQHKPFVITKRIDKSSPLLAKLLIDNENLSEWTLEVTGPTSKGEATLYRVKLTNASIASIKVTTDDNGDAHEVVSFTYQKIEWTWIDGGIMAADEWVPKSK